MKFATLALAGLIGTATASPLFKRQNSTAASSSSSPSSISSSPSSISSSASSSAPSSSSSSVAAGNSSSSGSSSQQQVTNATAPLNTTGVTDLDILQTALALETLEISFYRIGLNFDEDAYESAGFDSSVRQRFTEIISQEQTHVSVIQQTITELGGTPNGYCNYSFPNVTGVSSFLMTAQMINDVGPGAYIGNSGLIQNKTLTVTASQILSVEARHNAYVRGVNGNDEFPQTFQVPLTAGQAYTLGSQFIQSCPANNTPLIVTAKPSLQLSPLPPYSVGDTITLRQGAAFGPEFGVGNATNTPARNTTTQAISGDGLFAVFITGDMPSSYKSVPLGSNGSVKIPQGVTGQSYVLVSSSGTEVTDAGTIAGPAIVEVPVPARTFSSANRNPSGRVRSGANGSGRSN